MMNIRIEFPYSWVGHIPFAIYLVNNLTPKTIVELGTHSGNSLCSFLIGAKKYSPKTRVFGIDLWHGDEQAGYYDESVYSNLKEYIECNFSENGTLIRKDFNDAVNDFSNNSIDVLHIDGLHTYEAVRNDFYTWKPKLAKDGIILFHDINVKEKGFGVEKFWSELKLVYKNNFEFLHSNGLGVISLSDRENVFINELISNRFLIDILILSGNSLLETQVVKDELKSHLPKVSILENSRYYKYRSKLFNLLGL